MQRAAFLLGAFAGFLQGDATCRLPTASPCPVCEALCLLRSSKLFLPPPPPFFFLLFSLAAENNLKCTVASAWVFSVINSIAKRGSSHLSLFAVDLSMFRITFTYFHANVCSWRKEGCDAPGELCQGAAADAGEHLSQPQWVEAPCSSTPSGSFVEQGKPVGCLSVGVVCCFLWVCLLFYVLLLALYQ